MWRDASALNLLGCHVLAGADRAAGAVILVASVRSIAVMPKSRTFTVPSSATRMLAGLNDVAARTVSDISKGTPDLHPGSSGRRDGGFPLDS